jgi:phosphoglycerate kinase
MKTLRDFKVSQKRVLVRCDFNVPIDSEGNILDDFRIKKSIPTIEYLIKKKAKIILMSHLGRPKGKVVENLRLNKIQEKLMEYLDLSITKAPDCIGKEIEEFTKKEQMAGEILLLENLRFHIGEEKASMSFAKKLARLGDVYVNDAFATCHRNHASIVLIPKILPSGAGFLLEKEITSLNKIIKNPQKPLVAIFGGDDPDVKFLNKISKIAQWILIGGLIEKQIKEKNIKLKNPKIVIGPIDDIKGKDIGPKTIKLFKEKISKAKTIFWSGPLGKIEKKQFQKGTKEIAKAIAKSQAFSVVGGGETIDFIRDLNLEEKFSHLSTGGSAMLAFLAGEKLPGIEALK